MFTHPNTVCYACHVIQGQRKGHETVKVWSRTFQHCRFGAAVSAMGLISAGMRVILKYWLVQTSWPASWWSALICYWRTLAHCLQQLIMSLCFLSVRSLSISGLTVLQEICAVIYSKKIEILPFLESISSTVYNRSWQMATDSWTRGQHVHLLGLYLWYLA